MNSKVEKKNENRIKVYHSPITQEFIRAILCVCDRNHRKESEKDTIIGLLPYELKKSDINEKYIADLYDQIHPKNLFKEIIYSILTESFFNESQKGLKHIKNELLECIDDFSKWNHFADVLKEGPGLSYCRIFKTNYDTLKHRVTICKFDSDNIIIQNMLLEYMVTFIKKKRMKATLRLLVGILDNL